MLLKDKHIFIVEDNSQNRVVFQLALVRHGATIDFERSGRDVIMRLKALTRTHVDLILLDLMLVQGIQGIDVYDEIRTLEPYATVPVVAVSATDASTAIPQTRALGFAGFIAKPVDKYLFPQQLARILQGETIWYDGVREVS